MHHVCSYARTCLECRIWVTDVTDEAGYCFGAVIPMLSHVFATLSACQAHPDPMAFPAPVAACTASLGPFAHRAVSVPTLLGHTTSCRAPHTPPHILSNELRMLTNTCSSTCPAAPLVAQRCVLFELRWLFSRGDEFHDPLRLQQRWQRQHASALAASAHPLAGLGLQPDDCLPGAWLRARVRLRLALLSDPVCSCCHRVYMRRQWTQAPGRLPHVSNVCDASTGSCFVGC